jgi:hypothetical protein
MAEELISRVEVIPALLQACPSFQNTWDEHCYEHDPPLIYVALGDFARHLLDLHRNGDTHTISNVCRVIEQFCLAGDADVQEIVTIGVLESIQNVWSHSDVDPVHFRGHLQPESGQLWDELNAFWRGDRRYVGEGIQNEDRCD